VQRFNAVLLHDSLPVSDFTDWWSYPLCICLIFKLPREHIYRGSKNNNNNNDNYIAQIRKVQQIFLMYGKSLKFLKVGRFYLPVI